jgi:hypothetical protein
MEIPAVKRHLVTQDKAKAARDQNSRRPGALDVSLKLILDSLAALLVETGYGYTRLAKLAKASFVQAARSIEQGGAKVSNARIAALTGLTRTEVSHLLRQQKEDPAEAAEPENRALRVAKGWLIDLRFANQRGVPRRLPFKGNGATFSSLVKKYSGDIPARAMLSEMKRLRMVNHDSRDRVLLVREKLGVSRTTMLAIRAISPWVEMLTTRNGSNQLGEVTSKAHQVRLSFNSNSQLMAAVRELEHRRMAFLDGLERLGETAVGSRKHSLRVSIAVAAEKSIRKSKSRHKIRAGNA